MDTMEIEATVTKRGQTTLPSAIRKVLKVTAAEDRIVYRVTPDGTVVLAKKESADDPMIAEFLQFIARDTRRNFASLRPVTGEWLAGVQSLVERVEIDLNAPLSDSDE
jgi:antitoxin PrlF